MRNPIQPPAHRVNVQVNSHISTENAEAWRRHVESFGGSVEMAFDSLLTQLGPGLRLTRPKEFNNKFAQLRHKVDAVDAAHKQFIDLVDQDLESLAAKVDVAREQVNEALNALGKLKVSIASARSRLGSNTTAAAVADAVGVLESCDILLSSFDVEPAR